MGRIADIPEGYWITCVELGRGEQGLQFVVPGLEEFLDQLLGHTVTGHDPLLSQWKISVTKIDKKIPLANVMAQFRRDENSFEIQNSYEVNLAQLAQERGFRIVASSR